MFRRGNDFKIKPPGSRQQALVQKIHIILIQICLIMSTVPYYVTERTLFTSHLANLALPPLFSSSFDV